MDEEEPETRCKKQETCQAGWSQGNRGKCSVANHVGKTVRERRDQHTERCGPRGDDPWPPAFRRVEGAQIRKPYEGEPEGAEEAGEAPQEDEGVPGFRDRMKAFQDAHGEETERECIQ